MLSRKLFALPLVALAVAYTAPAKAQDLCPSACPTVVSSPCPSVSTCPSVVRRVLSYPAISGCGSSCLNTVPTNSMGYSTYPAGIYNSGLYGNGYYGSGYEGTGYRSPWRSGLFGTGWY